MKSLKAQKSIITTFEKDNNNPKDTSISIKGRGTSVLGKNQGDHVTAYGLVEKGIIRVLSNLTQSEINELFNLDNRNSLRDRRNNLYIFISNIAAMDPNTEKLYLGIDQILTCYNDVRESKKQLRKETRIYQDDPNLFDENLKAALSSIEFKYNNNGQHMLTTFKEISRLILTFYNHIPHTSYFSIEGFKASSNEGNTIKEAISKIEQSINICNQLPDGDTPEKQAKKDDDIIPSITNLIHYPEITDSVALREHETKTSIKGSKTLSQPRNNSKEQLIKSLARHLHIVFTVYPELKNFFNTKEILNPFIENIIKGTKTKKGWPSFNNEKDIEEINKKTLESLKKFKKLAKNNRYTARSAYKNLVSSGDEKESTIPVKKERPQNSNNELEELRSYRKIMENTITKHNIQIPNRTRELLKIECPSLNHDRSLSRSI